MAWLDSLKDTAIATGARTVLNSQIADFGKVSRLNLDTAARKIAFEVELEGEVTPVEVTLTGYEIVENQGRTMISAPAGAFAASRPWLTKLLNARLTGRSFELPEKLAGYAKMLIG